MTARSSRHIRMTDDDDDYDNTGDQKTGCCWLMMRPAIGEE